ncbi:dTDP-glucose 4,6-dehydratase [Candidatus Pacearchaeota archaeon]|jgi:dTDP-glucose 4,6-dehydratase|nr:dTDP-glucose 4,6-dehydratase [Candidatus Pacearchaeota archaeon]|tara:strand:+ start:3369 stop:4349 length:981 start_codon:yes stop_codon:yes gene_type:complete
MEKVAVIGSNSFSGAHFVDHLLENTDYKVIGISRSPESNSIFLPYKGKEGFKFFQENINDDLSNIVNILRKEDVKKVVNFAAQGMVGQSWDNPEHWFRTNCLGIANLTNKLRKIKSFEKYVQISTPEVYGSCNEIDENTSYNPSTPYASSKAAGDMFIQNLVKQFNFPANFVRSTNVYGPCQQLFRIIPRTIIYAKLGKKLQLQGGGKAIKSYLHVKDDCSGILKILEDTNKGEVYHLSPDSGISINNLVRKISNKIGKDFDDFSEIVDERKGQDKEYILNSSKARERFNWRPKVDFDKGIEQCVKWVDKNWDVIKTLPLEYIHKE